MARCTASGLPKAPSPFEGQNTLLTVVDVSIIRLFSITIPLSAASQPTPPWQVNVDFEPKINDISPLSPDKV